MLHILSLVLLQGNFNMPRDANGNTNVLPGTIVAGGNTILPSQHNPAMQDLYAMMEQSLSRDGQGGMRANINMNGFRIRNMGVPELPGDGVSLSYIQSAMPVGIILDFAGDVAPDGWLLCYGQAVSRTAYPLAFAACGTKFGAGDGATTFNIPDYRGRIGVGRDDMGGSDSTRLSFFGVLVKTIGGVFGVASHVLTTGQMPKHNHTGETNEAGEHTHPINNMGLWTSDGSTSVRSWGQNGAVYNTQPAGKHKHTIPEQGNDEAHTNAQPSIIVNKIIKVL